ncbi:uncharacterized protein SCDLUD_001048 [Saccharomycodes ludwigii]|uniref:uncharacterized protein n=1 Tax=Saccharomycodes ludwigii TaxID=36035 RepID=UPI001E86BB98|nr:hypothetical protein SCDLUD_001048 [Saccharomycodes ludwigii]KAH3903412.1 hypothetical protein SCDLUD_001048 [Saccharomycodes ludwigii]
MTVYKLKDLKYNCTVLTGKNNDSNDTIRYNPFDLISNPIINTHKSKVFGNYTLNINNRFNSNSKTVLLSDGLNIEHNRTSNNNNAFIKYDKENQTNTTTFTNNTNQVLLTGYLQLNFRPQTTKIKKVEIKLCGYNLNYKYSKLNKNIAPIYPTVDKKAGVIYHLPFIEDIVIYNKECFYASNNDNANTHAQSIPFDFIISSEKYLQSLKCKYCLIDYRVECIIYLQNKHEQNSQIFLSDSIEIIKCLEPGSIYKNDLVESGGKWCNGTINYNFYLSSKLLTLNKPFQIQYVLTGISSPSVDFPEKIKYLSFIKIQLIQKTYLPMDDACSIHDETINKGNYKDCLPHKQQKHCNVKIFTLLDDKRHNFYNSNLLSRNENNAVTLNYDNLLVNEFYQGIKLSTSYLESKHIYNFKIEHELKITIGIITEALDDKASFCINTINSNSIFKNITKVLQMYSSNSIGASGLALCVNNGNNNRNNGNNNRNNGNSNFVTKCSISIPVVLITDQMASSLTLPKYR